MRKMFRSGFIKRGPRPLLRERFSGAHEQRPSLDSFAEAYISTAKPKCHNIKYSSVKLKFAVFIITSLTFVVTFGDAFFWNVLELSGTL